MKKTVQILFVAVFGILLIAGSSLATTMHVGHPIVMIDGTNDGNTSVGILANDGNSGTYDFGYFRNHGSTFNVITGVGTILFENGDIVDYGFYDATANSYYTLSGDGSDSSYSVTMDFSGPLNSNLAEDQLLISHYGISEYYKNVTMTWNLPGSLIYNTSFAMHDRNDGQYPVPEPGTLMLLGSGLAGVGFYTRRRKNK